jgi:hypothetical protein
MVVSPEVLRIRLTSRRASVWSMAYEAVGSSGT